MEKKNGYQTTKDILDDSIVSSDLLIKYQNWAIERIIAKKSVSWREFCNSPTKESV